MEEPLAPPVYQTKTVASDNMDMNLHTLGWKDFERLSRTILTEVFGAPIETYRAVKDLGKDGAFIGELPAKLGSIGQGPAVLQCKHSGLAGSPWKAQLLKNDLPKVAHLVETEKLTSYILLTNMVLSAEEAGRTRRLVLDTGVKQCFVFGKEWIEERIRESGRLRMLVPRLYGLGDLSQILDERVYAQTGAILEGFREQAPKFVPTGAYGRAATAISEHGFVLLVGEPASGKTTIASLLALSAADQWKSKVVFVSRLADIKEHWNPEDPHQYFWIDDAFGATRFDASRAHEWNALAPIVRAALRKGARFVMTSRDYIYRAARSELKVGSFPLLDEAQVTIRVQELELEEKQQILYNHLKMGKQARPFIAKIKPFLPEVAASPRFLPETARRLGDPRFTTNLQVTSFGVMQFVGAPEQFLIEIIDQLDPDSRSALCLLLAHAGRLASPIQVTDESVDLVTQMGGDPNRVSTCLQALEGSFVVLRRVDGHQYWAPAHPTLLDALAKFIGAQPELVGIYVRTVKLARLVREISLLDGSETGVFVPRSLWDTLIDRIGKALSGPERSQLWYFLYRAPHEFLERLLNRRRELQEVPDFGWYLHTDERFQVYCRMASYGLLGKSGREQIVTQARDALIQIGDPEALRNRSFLEVISDNDRNAIENDVRDELLPRLCDLASNDYANRNRNAKDPLDDFSMFFELLDAVEAWFPGDVQVHRQVEEARRIPIELAAEELHAAEMAAEIAMEDAKLEAHGLADRGDSAVSLPERSIFDDL